VRYRRAPLPETSSIACQEDRGGGATGPHLCLTSSIVWCDRYGGVIHIALCRIDFSSAAFFKSRAVQPARLSFNGD
jgi:hypothetical protein